MEMIFEVFSTFLMVYEMLLGILQHRNIFMRLQFEDDHQQREKNTNVLDRLDDFIIMLKGEKDCGH
jgi:hypothetical protein